MTDSKDKTGIMPEKGDGNRDNSQDISGAGIIVSGISGTKTLRVGRVNKKVRPPKDEVTETADVITEQVPNAPVAVNVPTPPAQTPVQVEVQPVTTQVAASVAISDAPVIEKQESIEPEVKKPAVSASVEEEQKRPTPPVTTAPPVRNGGSAPSVTETTSRSTFIRPTGREGAYNSGPQGQGGYSGRPQGSGPYNQDRSGGPGGNYGGPRSSDRPGGFSGPRPGGDRPGGYTGPRPGGDRPGGYTGPRPGGDRPGGFSGPRPGGDRPGGYAGPSRPGGYQGQSRPGGFSAPGASRSGGFGGSRPGGFAKPDDDDNYAPRGQGGSKGPSKPKSSDLPVEISKEKANFAARDAFEKSRKDSSKDTKKDAGKPGTTQTDKRLGNKNAVTSVFSGMGATAILSDDAALDAIYQASPKGRRGGSRRRPSTAAQAVQKAVLTHVTLPEFITIKDFSEGIQKRSAEVIKKLMKLGMLATINQEIDFETATLIAEEFGITTELRVEVKEEDILFDDTEDTDELLQTRPPVVVVMGHVDHGKTSLLDKIRSASVVKGEAGGITQHIGAYTVKLKGRFITFLDTPGHEAFTTMRARGAQVTDIAILVVAADDGVMPQTIEAINHAKAANTEIIVAINKMDRPGANPDKVKQELSLHGVLPEEWGGTTIVVPVSAHTGEGIDELLEMVLLTADVMDLKADPNKQAKGTVIEAKLDKSRGPVATVLVQRGTLRSGDTLVTGSIVGRVRAMTDDKGASVKKAGPSIPVEVLGLPEVPDAGDIFYAVTDEKVARQLVEKRRVKQREDQLRKSSRMTLETLSESLAAGEVKDLNLIIKADVQGSVEAVLQSLEKLSTDEIHVKVIHGAVGAVTETDLILAEVSNAVIIGFNIRPSVAIAEKAKEIGVDIKLYRVIYNAIEDIQAAIKGMLKPIFEEAVLGHIEIRQIFKVSNVGTIGGAYVTDGKIPRSSEVRVVRNGIVVHEGKLASLKRFKDDAKEVQAGYECGLSVENYNDIKEGDIIEAFEMREIKRK